jgi:hypothetical protein
VLGFDVTPTVGLVTEVLRAGHARPDAGHLQHVLHQDLRRVWKKWQPGDFLANKKRGSVLSLFSTPLSKREVRANFGQRLARLGRCHTLRPYFCISRESAGRWIDRLKESLSSDKKALIMLTLLQVSLKS